MKHVDVTTSRSCSCTSYLFKSESDLTSVRRLHGSRIDKHYLGKNIPVRERKLLRKLARTGATYDDLRSQLFSRSNLSISDKADLKPRKNMPLIQKGKELDYVEKNCAINLVDKGSDLESRRLCKCFSGYSCSCIIPLHENGREHIHGHALLSSKPSMVEHRVKHESGVQRHVHHKAKSSMVSGHRVKEKRHVRRHVRLKAKHILSEPCTCTSKLSELLKRESKALIKQHGRKPEPSYERPFDSFGENEMRYDRKSKNFKLREAGMGETIKDPLAKRRLSQAKIAYNIMVGTRKSLEKSRVGENNYKVKMENSVKKSIHKVKLNTQQQTFENHDNHEGLFEMRKETRNKSKYREDIQGKRLIVDSNSDLWCDPDECVQENLIKNITEKRLRIKFRKTDEEKTKVYKRKDKPLNASKVGIHLTNKKVATELATKSKKTAASDFNYEVCVTNTDIDFDKIKGDEDQAAKQTKNKVYKLGEPTNKVTSGKQLVTTVRNKCKVKEQIQSFNMGRKSTAINQHEQVKRVSTCLNNRNDHAKQVVRIGSNFSFIVEFFKSKTVIDNYTNLSIMSKPVEHLTSSRNKETQRKINVRHIDSQYLAKKVRSTLSEVVTFLIRCTSKMKKSDKIPENNLNSIIPGTLNVMKDEPKICQKTKKSNPVNPKKALKTHDQNECKQKCLKRIQKTMSNADAPRGNPTTTSKPERLNAKTTTGLKKAHTGEARENLVTEPRPRSQSPTKSKKQVVRIDSNVCFDIELFKENSMDCAYNINLPITNLTKNVTATQIAKTPKTRHAVFGNQAKFVDRQFQSYGFKSESKSSKVGPLMKLCLCTLKLHKVGKLYLKDKTKLEPKRKFKNNIDESKILKDASTKTKKKRNALEPYECEPNTCIPGQCDPLEYYEIIKLRNLMEFGTDTFRPLTHSVSSSSELETHIKKLQSPMENAGVTKSTNQAKQKPECISHTVNFNNKNFQTVRMASKFIYDAEKINVIPKTLDTINAHTHELKINHKSTQHKKIQTLKYYDTENKTSMTDRARRFCTTKFHHKELENVITIGRVDNICTMSPFKPIYPYVYQLNQLRHNCPNDCVRTEKKTASTIINTKYLDPDVTQETEKKKIQLKFSKKKIIEYKNIDPKSRQNQEPQETSKKKNKDMSDVKNDKIIDLVKPIQNKQISFERKKDYEFKNMNTILLYKPRNFNKNERRTILEVENKLKEPKYHRSLQCLYQGETRGDETSNTKSKNVNLVLPRQATTTGLKKFFCTCVSLFSKREDKNVQHINAKPNSDRSPVRCPLKPLNICKSLRGLAFKIDGRKDKNTPFSSLQAGDTRKKVMKTKHSIQKVKSSYESLICLLSKNQDTRKAKEKMKQYEKNKRYSGLCYCLQKGGVQKTKNGDKTKEYRIYHCKADDNQGTLNQQLLKNSHSEHRESCTSVCKSKNTKHAVKTKKLKCVKDENGIPMKCIRKKKIPCEALDISQKSCKALPNNKSESVCESVCDTECECAKIQKQWRKLAKKERKKMNANIKLQKKKIKSKKKRIKKGKNEDKKKNKQREKNIKKILKKLEKRRKTYKHEDAVRRKQRKRRDKKLMQNLQKYQNCGDRVLLADTDLDIARLGCKARSTVCGRKDAGVVSKNTCTTVRTPILDSGICSTADRIKFTMGSIRRVKCARNKSVECPVKNCLPNVHHKIPKKKLCRKKTKIFPKPFNYRCSLFKSSLRRRPWVCVYYLCPWFYPHCLGLLSTCKQCTNVMLMLLAMIVCCPFILLMECCRALMCCLV